MRAAPLRDEFRFLVLVAETVNPEKLLEDWSPKVPSTGVSIFSIHPEVEVKSEPEANANAGQSTY